MNGDAAQRQASFLLFTVLMVIAAGNNALASVLPAIGRAIGISDVLIAFVFSLSAMFWAISAPFWARQSDKRGRKALVQLGLLGFIVSGIAFGCVVMGGIHGWLTPMAAIAGFVLTRSLFGLMGSAANPAAQAYIAARTSRTERTGALAMLSSAFGLGTVVGPAVAPFFVLPFVGLAGPLFFFVLAAGVVLWVVRRYLPADAPESGNSGTVQMVVPKKLSFGDRRIRPYLIYGFVAGSAQAALSQVLGFYIIDLLGTTPQEAQPYIGVAMMAGAGATLLAQWGLIRMFAMTPQSLMQWGAGLAAAGSALLAVAGSFGTVVTAFSLMSLGFGFARPGFTAAASLAVPMEEQGGAAGAITAINGACFILAPAIGVALYQWAQPVPFWAGGALLAALLVYACFERQMRAMAHAHANEMTADKAGTDM